MVAKIITLGGEACGGLCELLNDSVLQVRVEGR